MLQTWWHATMDARRVMSLLIGVTGLALVALSVAASSVPLAFDGTLLMAVSSPAFGAAAGGYVGHRSSAPRRRAVWAFAYGISSGALIAGMFATAALVRPTVQAMPGLGDAGAGLFAAGCLLGFVGALLWERDPRRRRVAAWLLLAVWLIAGGVVVGVSPGPWAWLGALACLAGFGVLLHAVVSNASLQAGAAVPGLWPPASVRSDPTHRGTS
jgi:drug/metabolite transporter (DMT)-like permease